MRIDQEGCFFYKIPGKNLFYHNYPSQKKEEEEKHVHSAPAMNAF